MSRFDDLYSREPRELFDYDTDIGQWCSYAPYTNPEQLAVQNENLFPVDTLRVVDGNLKIIFTKRMKSLSRYLETISKTIPITDTTVALENEVFYTATIEGARTTRVRTSEIHNGSPIREDNRESEIMIRNGFRAVKLLNLYGYPLSKEKLCRVWEALVEECCHNEEARGPEGEYRIGDVGVGPHNGLPCPEIEQAMQIWLDFFNSDRLNDYLFVKAAILHYSFENIHPYCDGNGRLGRFLMSHFLIQNGVESLKAVSFSMAINDNRGAYYGAFVDSENEQADCTPFVEYMLETMAKAFENVSKKRSF